jgi:uncharacterized membrane protein YecN with MAPEG domain
MRFATKAAAILICLLGLVHLGFGFNAFVQPTEPRIWFASAGFLLIVTGLCNLAAERTADRLIAVAALTGNASILILGSLFAVATPDVLAEPQSLLLIALGLFLAGRVLVAAGSPSKQGF